MIDHTPPAIVQIGEKETATVTKVSGKPQLKKKYVKLKKRGKHIGRSKTRKRRKM